MKEVKQGLLDALTTQYRNLRLLYLVYLAAAVLALVFFFIVERAAGAVGSGGDISFFIITKSQLNERVVVVTVYIHESKRVVGKRTESRLIPENCAVRVC